MTRNERYERTGQIRRHGPLQRHGPPPAFPLLALCFAAALLSACGRMEYLKKEVGARIEKSEVTSVVSALMEMREPEDPYDVIYQALAAYETEIQIRNSSPEEIKTAYLAVLEDHPELFWVANGYSSAGYALGSASLVTLVPLISDGREEILRKQQELWDAVQEVFQALPAGATEYEKALFFHDWLVRHTEYDLNAYNDLTASAQTTDRVVDSSTAYGCLVKHLAICSGYSSAYQLLLHEAGIPCGRISGIGRDGPHEWNYLCLDGAYYYVDVTWDDPVSENGVSTCSHAFFCITGTELLENHIIDPDQFIPQCTETAYNYYRYFGLYLPEYSFQGVSAIVEAHKTDELIEMAFSSPQELHRAEEALFEEQRIFDIPAVRDTGAGIVYSTGSSNRILQLCLDTAG